MRVVGDEPLGPVRLRHKACRGEKSRRLVKPFDDAVSCHLLLGFLTFSSLVERDSPRFHELLPNSQGNRKQLLDELARSRIYFSAVTAEGFGLIPLEAMSLGCIVLGLDGHGSRDYLRHGENSFCVKLKNLRLLPGLFNEIVDSLDEMDSIVDNAIETASYYSYERFRLAWTKVLERFL